jgi:hypothetical protein
MSSKVTTTKAPGKFITATATRSATGDTSEFSVPTGVVSQ